MTELQRTSSELSTRTSSYGIKKKLILLHLVENTNVYTPTNVSDIADALNLNESTIRYYLNQLYKENKILKQKVGMTTTFWTQKTHLKMAQTITPPPGSLLSQIHGIVLFIRGLTSSDPTLGIKCKCADSVFSLNFIQKNKSKKSGYCVCRRCGASIRNNFSYKRVWRERDITWKYGKHKKSCTVWVGCSLSPLDYFDFKDLLNHLEGLVGIRVWDNLDLWQFKQGGFHNDVRKSSIDAVHFDCTLNDFGHVFARIYEKDWVVDTAIETGVRFEVHLETIQKLNNYFMPLIQSSMDMSAVLNINAALHMKIGDLVDELKVSNKRQRRMEDKMDRHDKEIEKLLRKKK